MLVIVIPLLQEGAMLGVHLWTDGWSATLRLLRDIYLRREWTTEALHIYPSARISWKTLEEGRVDGGGDTWVEAVRVRAGNLVDGVRVDGINRVGCGRGRGAGLDGPRGAEPREGWWRRPPACALHLLGREVRKSGAETSGQHVAGATAIAVIYMVGDRGVHLDLVWIYERGRWRRSIGFSRFHWRAAAVSRAGVELGEGLALRQVTERSLGWGRLCGAKLSVLT